METRLENELVFVLLQSMSMCYMMKVWKCSIHEKDNYVFLTLKRVNVF